MFRIEPNTLYSKDDLKVELGGMCHIETFLRDIRPSSPIKGLYLGENILEAIRNRAQEKKNGDPFGGIGAENEKPKTSKSRRKANLISFEDVKRAEGENKGL